MSGTKTGVLTVVLGFTTGRKNEVISGQGQLIIWLAEERSADK